MKKKILSFAAIAMLFAACSSDEPNPPPDAENIPQVANPYRVSLDDALDNAETLLSQISEAETRSGRRVASVKYLTTPSTRSADSDTMLYLINYENDGGFALLSADSRLRPVYAISDEGSLNLEDTVYNKGLAMFARGVEAEIASIIAPPVIDTTFNPVVPTPVITTIYQHVEPLLGASQRRWGQDLPYNTYCYTTDGQQAVVGCAAVAVGQVMSYYQWPQSYGGETFPWAAMNAGYNNDKVAKFLRLLGNSENLTMTYGVSLSTSSPNNIARTFENLGYQNPGNMQTFSTAGITQRLTAGKNNQPGGGPVICEGYSTSETVGHGWVIDGFIQYQSTSNAIIGNTIIGPPLLHCVWGWGGTNNGYFHWNDGFSGEPTHTEDDEDVETLPYDFNLDVRFLGGFIVNN